MGKLIVFEGIDGSGKSTQFRLMCGRFENEGVPFARLTFPQYQEPSSALIKMYLNGEFGENPEAVNPYAASTFFAVDRYASYMKVWRDLYTGGNIILTDRYTTSNALHQGSKLPEGGRSDFFSWLYDFEFRLMELPKPDIVIYMDIEAEKAAERIKKRQAVTGTAADIHERNLGYLRECARCGAQAAEYYGWRKLSCFHNGAARSEEEIHEEIREILSVVGVKRHEP
ncbi:MAG: deoxynucleoside kinase [Clostridiales bacterium]|nr:deoxynucleoside kinase [Clostridiales bacterium]